MFPPDSTMPTRWPASCATMSHHRGERGGARSLGHGLFDLEQGEHGLLEVDLADEQDLTKATRAGFHGSALPGRLTAMPSAIESRPQAIASPARACFIEGKRSVSTP